MSNFPCAAPSTDRDDSTFHFYSRAPCPLRQASSDHRLRVPDKTERPARKKGKRVERRRAPHRSLLLLVCGWGLFPSAPSTGSHPTGSSELAYRAWQRGLRRLKSSRSMSGQKEPAARPHVPQWSGPGRCSFSKPTSEGSPTESGRGAWTHSRVSSRSACNRRWRPCGARPLRCWRPADATCRTQRARPTPPDTGSGSRGGCNRRGSGRAACGARRGYTS